MRPIKDICLYLDEIEGRDSALRASKTLANVMNATVNAIHALPEHTNLSVDTNGYFRKLADEKAARLRTLFEREMNHDLLEHSWATKSGNTVNVVLEAFRYADIGVVSQPTDVDGRFINGVIDEIVCSSDAPVFCVPHTLQPTHHFDRIVVAYDRTHASVRAIRDAMPFLIDAKLVELVHTRRPDARVNIDDATSMLHHLKHHGVNCSVIEIASTAPPAELIIQRAIERDATLIVTGSTEHTTEPGRTPPRSIHSLIHNSPVPTFYSH